jgi:diguanylate cyclase (GGDEF)-like protein/PAS domain S-box-containing protein
MPSTPPSNAASKEQAQEAEISRLNKIVKALMDHAERSTNAQGSDFSIFKTTIMLENQVRRRTEELEAALRENERINRALSESEAKFRGVVSQSLAGIALIEDGRLIYANPKLAEIFGYEDGEMLGITPNEIVAESDMELVIEQTRRRLSGEEDKVAYGFQGLRKNGTVIDIECHSSVMEIGCKPVFVSLMIDITERVRAEREVRALQDQLREQAIHDPLTGLYNRLPLNEFFDHELRAERRHSRPICIVLADIDHFKAVNDVYGHLAGDEVLKMFSGLIRHFYRASDIPCRYGGDEFLILLPNMPLEAACQRTENLRNALETTPVVYGTSQIRATATFGIAAFPQHGKTRDELIAAADRALYAAKERGRNQIGNFSLAMDRHA